MQLHKNEDYDPYQGSNCPSHNWPRVREQEGELLESLYAAGHEWDVTRYGSACRDFGESLAELVPLAKRGEKVEASQVLQLLAQLRQELLCWVKLQRLSAGLR